MCLGAVKQPISVTRLRLVLKVSGTTILLLIENKWKNMDLILLYHAIYVNEIKLFQK